MQAAIWNTIPRLRNPPFQPSSFALFHSSPISLAKWKNKWNIKEEGTDQQPSKTYIRYAVRQKRADTKSALKNLLLNGKTSTRYFQDEEKTWCNEKLGSTNARVKDSSHDVNDLPRSKNSRKSKPNNSSCSGKGKRSSSKRWQNKNSFHDEDDYEQPETIFSATFGGQRCFTWSFNSSENFNFHSSTAGFEWRDDSKWEKAKKRVWSESDIDDEPIGVGSHSHRVALGLPSTGPLNLDDVKHAFRASALKWHPDKHQGPSQTMAEEKFKLCVDAYNSLCSALKST